MGVLGVVDGYCVKSDVDEPVGEVRSKSPKCVPMSNSVAEAGAESAVADE